MKFTGPPLLSAQLARARCYVSFSANAKNSGAWRHSAGYWKLNSVAPGFKRSFLHYASITVDALPSALHNHQHHILRDGRHGSVDRESKGKDARRPLQDDSVGSVKEDSLNTLNVYTLQPLVILRLVCEACTPAHRRVGEKGNARACRARLGRLRGYCPRAGKER